MKTKEELNAIQEAAAVAEEDAELTAEELDHVAGGHRSRLYRVEFICRNCHYRHQERLTELPYIGNEPYCKKCGTQMMRGGYRILS